jgi:transcriptional regulator GlxA family with amidase domain
MAKEAELWLNRVMHSPRSIALLVFEGAQILNITGSAAVFAAANNVVEAPVYAIHVLSPFGGPVKSMSAITISTEPISAVDPQSVDTLLFTGSGDHAAPDAFENEDIRQWILHATSGCRRFGSSSAPATLALGRLGLLDGIRVTTHWSACDSLSREIPGVIVDANAIYVEHGRVWTSAGVSTGIDMTLQMVARDLGESVANEIAKRLVLETRRPGYQPQYSEVVAALKKADNDFSELITWIKAHLPDPMSVECLAARAKMSPRNFQRKFNACVGQPPARFVETLRLQHALGLLSTGLSAKVIANTCGYANPQQLAKAFQRQYGSTPAKFLRDQQIQAAGPSRV